MSSWIKCPCGSPIHTNLFAGTDVYQLIKDADYDAIEDPVDRGKLEKLFFDSGIPAYHCKNCGRLAVQWTPQGEPVFYVPEAH